MAVGTWGYLANLRKRGYGLVPHRIPRAVRSSVLRVGPIGISEPAGFARLAGRPGGRAIGGRVIVAKYEADENSLTMNDALLYERLVSRLLSIESLRRKVMNVRGRYRRMVSPEDYQGYMDAHRRIR